METRETTLNIPPAPRRAWLRSEPLPTGLILMTLGLVMVAFFLQGGLLGLMLVAAFLGGGLMLLAAERPLLPLAALILVTPFNYGYQLGGASIKLSELIAMAMAGLILVRLASGAGGAWQRVRRAAPALIALTLLGVLAVVTALPHPNAFNVRYELWNYVAFAYAILFFERSWWRPLVWLLLGTLAAESAITLVLRFGFGLTGVSFFSAGSAIDAIQFNETDLENLAGGYFRLSGTFGHKNLLAAFYVLTLPLVGLEMLNSKRFSWLFVLVPGLVTLALTDSMTGWGALLLTVVLALIHLRRFDYLALLALLVLPLGAAALVKFGDSVFARIGQLMAGQEGWNTVSSRQQIYDIARHLIAEYPLAGIGRNNFLSYGQTYYTHAHNLALMKMIEMGVAAGAAFCLTILALMGRAWWSILRETGRLAAQQQYFRTLGLWLGCLGFLAMNMLDYNYSNFSLGPLFMGFLGILSWVALDLGGAGGMDNVDGVDQVD